MKFLSRRIVMNNDLNGANSLFGGRALEWIDEEAAIFAMCQLETKNIVTKHIGEISFQAPASLGEIVEFGVETKRVGKSSITVKCVVRNKDSKRDICIAEEIVFVHIDPQTKQPKAHGKTIENLPAFDS